MNKIAQIIFTLVIIGSLGIVVLEAIAKIH
jgi:hypothetical protein